MAKVELQVNQENSILRDTVHRRVTSVLEGGKGETFSVHFGEFDDYYYGIHSEKKEPLRLTLSMSIPTGGLPTGATQLVSQAYDSIAPGVVTVQNPAKDGYHLSLECHLDKITNEETGNLFSKKISMLRSLVQGIPLRKILSDLQQGKSSDRSVECIKYKHDRAMYVKPLSDSVIIVFPLHFDDANDATIAINFLQHFAETKRTQQSLSNSPSCTYHLQAPLEVKEAMKNLGVNKSGNGTIKGDGQTNGGYMSFSVFPRNVKTDASLDLCTWKMCTFYAFISYHIKASKGHIQSRMRTKADDWLGVLAEAKATTKPKKQVKKVI